MKRHANLLAGLAGMSLLGACTAAPVAAPVAGPLEAPQSILHSSTPADGSIVSGPVDTLVLRFSPPARLGEVTVTGSDGLTTPMMVTAVGEVADYSIPVQRLGPGVYTVHWRASAAGTAHNGSFRFTVR